MAKEWYLMTSPYNQVSGYENDSLLDFGAEGFLEALETDIASDVEICNYDLSECTPMRAIIQNRVQDTELQSLTRQMLVPIGSCKAGMYVKYKNRYWLIVGFVDNNTMYEKAVLSLCNWLLTWVNDNGEIIQRWCNAVSASQYNNGETGMQFYFVRSDQLLVALPDDDESIMIPDRKRFIIDKRCRIYAQQIGDDITKDTSKKVITYQLTRSDTVLYDYGDSGHMEFIATQDEQHDGLDGYYVVDGKGYWLCDIPTYTSDDDKNRILSCSIYCEDNVVYNGVEPTIFKAMFYDENGDTVEIKPEWEIKCDFSDELDIDYIDDYISISTDNSRLINKSFELFLSGDGYEATQIIVYIRAFI